MDNVTAIVLGAVALGALAAYLIRWNRWLRTRRLIDDLLRAYFQGKMPVGQLGQRAREIASRQFFGGPTFFALAARAFQHATDAKRAERANSKDEDELVRRLGELKREFGVPDRYKSEGWRPGRE